MVYGLKDKKYFQFYCVAKTEEEFEEKVERAYRNWRASRSRSDSEETKTKEIYLEDYFKVKITITKL